MQLQERGNLTLRRCLREATRNAHRRYVSLAGLLMCVYAGSFVGFQISSLLKGHSDSILNFGFLALALRNLFRSRQELKTLKAFSDDRFLGYALLVFGALFLLVFRIFHTSISFQALSSMLMIVGIFLSTWGLEFFYRFWATASLIIVALYPDIGFVAIRVFRFLLSDNLLEQIMAWAGSFSLNLMGYQAIAESIYVKLPEGTVEVASGCSGFDMALSTVGIGFLIGQFMDASGKRTVGIMFAGWALALVFNVPRIMLLAIASVYWGQESFDFWHGPIGGQIFSGILFTVYYYVAMWLLEYKPRKSTTA